MAEKPLVLLDQNVPKGIKSWLSDVGASTAFEMGWAQLRNGELMEAAEQAGFRVSVTADKNIGYQQNVRSRRLSVVVLPTNDWGILRDAQDVIAKAIADAAEREFAEVLSVAPRPGSR